MSTAPMSITNSLAVLRRVRTRHLPPRLRAAFEGFGAIAIPGLVAILEDERLAEDTSQAYGLPREHAVDLLTDMRDPAAIGPMLHVLLRTDGDCRLHNRILARLPDFGHAALEPTLSELKQSTDDDLRADLCDVLARLNVRDDRVFAALKECFATNPTMVAYQLAIYGDPSALPLVLAAIRHFDPETSLIFELNEIVEAYEELGGTLPPDIHAQVENWRAEWDVEIRMPSEVKERQKVGRNEPCPCGSGKKFKNCCITQQYSS